jgi:hypothetical protein
MLHVPSEIEKLFAIMNKLDADDFLILTTMQDFFQNFFCDSRTEIYDPWSLRRTVTRPHYSRKIPRTQSVRRGKLKRCRNGIIAGAARATAKDEGNGLSL